MTLKYTSEFHATIQVNDMDRAKKFYSETLGLKLVDDIPEANWASFQTAVEAAKVGISKPFEGDVVASNVVNLHVENASDARKLLGDKGLSTSDMTHFPGMISMFSIEDPDGNGLTFIGPPEQAAPS